jgi:hypothetical protein
MKKNSKRKVNLSGMGNFLSPLVFCITVAFALTTGLLGYQLGRNGAGGSGALVDTIVLSPKQGDTAGKHYLAGKVVYADGSPCIEATVSLGRITGETDGGGKFLLSQLQGGEHLLTVEKEGEILAETQVSLDFSAEMPSLEITAEKKAKISLPEDTRLLEVELTVEEGGVNFSEDTLYLVDQEGSILDFEGNAYQKKQEQLLVTAQGNIITEENGEIGIYLPPQKIEITEEDAAPVQPGEEIEDGLQVEEDGSVSTEDGTTVLPDGSIQPPQQEPVSPEEPVIVENGEIQPAPSVPAATPSPASSFTPSPDGEGKEEDTVSSQPETTPFPDEPVNSPGEDENVSENTSPSEPENPMASPEPTTPLPEVSPLPEPVVTPSPSPSPSATPALTPSPEPEEETGGLQISDRETGVSWRQQSAIDLFRRRTSGEELGEQDGLPVIAPGSSGYYDFKLSNQESFDIDFVIAIEELSFHLPILYSIQNLETGEYYIYGSKTGNTGKTQDDLIAPVVRLPANTENVYRILWEWQYEDWFTASEDDAIDTQATMEKSPVYLLAVDITAEQVIPPQQDTPDEDTKYPAK